MQKGEEYRNKWALGFTIIIFLFIFTGFGFYKGYINLGNGEVMAQKKSSNQVANVVAADLAPSPFDNSKKTFSAAFDEIAKQYDLFKESVSAVLVPFVTSIDVYESK